MTSCVLGCGEGRALVTDRCGERSIVELEGITDLRWQRIIDDSSEAQVTVAIGGDANTACCQALGDIRSWAHALQVLREDELVWEGPIVDIDYRYDQVTITARDVTAWLDVRTTHNPIDYTADSGTGPVDLSVIAQAIISSALSPDDPCILPYLTIVPTGVLGEKELDPDEEIAGDVLRELARAGLDYTAIGRRILIGPDINGIFTASGQAFVHLVDEHFTAFPRILEAGTEAATRWIVKGDGDVKASAGGTDPYYGLIEQIATEDQIEHPLLAFVAARSRLESSNPPPVYADLTGGSGLVPEAPVCINDLIPGRLVDLTTRRLCRELTQSMRLVGVNVRYPGGGTEAVNIILAPPGTLGSQRQPVN